MIEQLIKLTQWVNHRLNVQEKNQMVIEYKIKRLDIVKAYFYNLRHSRRSQMIIFGMAALLVLYSMFLNYRRYGKVGFSDFFFAILFGLVFICAVPALSFLTAKTQKRTLSISQEGIETKIGSQTGKIPWKAVDRVVATEDHIFIVGKNANAFTIPSSAFANPELRNQFIELASQYHGSLKTPSGK
jgi:hypothetical protein